MCVRSKDKELFYIPGGKRELEESDKQALTREVKEEVCVDLLVETIRYANTFTGPADGEADNSIVKLSCYFADFQGKLKPDAEIAELAFLSYQEKNRCSVAAAKVFDWLKAHALLE
ncbi:DNA mismatch repair protein MutT [Thalassotalea insulae]|uniref:DNA mismatch repair protein MutT n=1 Tax=Thalassotalea insulae TaxID=2056778 RepID=A0ABQ6GLF7_9GAMM|nr:NUDIX domain-containing protein [Thalassotalea insulae]GLX76845.1 DNA mismatch repair protein MutT [Thalassotalea insulae]